MCLIGSSAASLRIARQAAAHYQLQSRMSAIDVQESIKREQVEHDLRHRELNLILNRHIETDKAEVALYQKRHRKAKKRALQLADSLSQRESEVSHLRRSLVMATPRRTRAPNGLEALSTAASLQQTPNSTDLMSPALIYSATPKCRSYNRRSSDSTVDDEELYCAAETASAQYTPAPEPSVNRRLQFEVSPIRTKPVTPTSPRLLSSAMS